jgi:hypothetical protein
MSSCVPPTADKVIEPLAGQTVISGFATQSGRAVNPGYARLVDPSGEFVAEVPLTTTGEYRFFARPGTWTVKLLAAGVTKELQVTAAEGVNSGNDFSL